MTWCTWYTWSSEQSTSTYWWDAGFDIVSSSQGVPAAPNRPIAQERSCTSVILRWLPPTSTGNCTISGYTVEYREEGECVSWACWLWDWEQGKFPLWHNRSQKHSCHHWCATNCSLQISKSKAERSRSIIQSSLSYITDLSFYFGPLQQVKWAKVKHIHH